MIFSTAVWPDSTLVRHIIPGWSAILLFVSVPILFILLGKRFRGYDISPFERSAAGLCFGLFVFLYSSGAEHPWFFIPKWFKNGGFSFSSVHLFTLAVIAGLTLLTVNRDAPHREKIRYGGTRAFAPLLLVLLVLFMALSYAALLRHTDMTALYRDDHPSFMFRLREYARTFPAMTTLNPWWNAGVVNSVGSSSGIGAVALPFFFVWRHTPVHECYTPLIGVLYIFIAPLLTLFGLRAIRASWTSALVGGILALGTTRAFFVWALHFGTVGAMFATSFLPLFALLAYRICVLRKTDIATLIAFAISAFFLAQWPPCLIMAAALVPGTIWNIRHLRIRTLLALAISALFAALLYLPNIIALLSNKELMSFVAGGSAVDAAAKAPLPSLATWGKLLVDTLTSRLPEVHPLVLFFGLSGFAVLPYRHLRRWLLPAVICLFLLAAWGGLVAPRMQLERMAIPAVLLSSIPAALLAGRLLRCQTSFLALPQASVLALLVFGGLAVVSLYKGKGYAPYTSLPPEIASFAQTVEREVPPDGRLLFYGKTVHAFGGGHVAYLPLLAHREMLSCDYYAFPPGMVEYDFPPRPWRNTAEGIADYMRLFGATHLATAIPNRAQFIRDSGLFTEISFTDPPEQAGRIALFALNGAKGGRFHSGTAEIDADFGRIVVKQVGNREPGTETCRLSHVECRSSDMRHSTADLSQSSTLKPQTSNPDDGGGQGLTALPSAPVSTLNSQPSTSAGCGDIVLRYRWDPSLDVWKDDGSSGGGRGAPARQPRTGRAGAPRQPCCAATIYPVEVADGVTFIGVRFGKAGTAVISYHGGVRE